MAGRTPPQPASSRSLALCNVVQDFPGHGTTIGHEAGQPTPFDRGRLRSATPHQKPQELVGVGSWKAVVLAGGLSIFTKHRRLCQPSAVTVSPQRLGG